MPTSPARTSARPPTPTTPATASTNTPKAIAAPTTVFDMYLTEDQEDHRGLRVSLVFALAAHLLLLFCTIPTLSSTELEPAKKPEVVLISKTPRFKKPEVPKKKPIKRRAKATVPVPDLTPDGPEIVVETQAEEIFIDEPEFEWVIPSRPPEPAATGPIRVGMGVKPPVKIFEVAPRYTEAARRARIQGTVILESVIDETGLVTDVKVLRGQPLGLSEEAVAAVKQWRFEPSVLDGKPVAVIHVLTVIFRLQ